MFSVIRFKPPRHATGGPKHHMRRPPATDTVVLAPVVLAPEVSARVQPLPRRARSSPAGTNPMLGLVRFKAPRHAIERAKQNLLRRSATKVAVAAPILSATVVVAEGGELARHAHVVAGGELDTDGANAPVAPGATATTTVPVTPAAPTTTHPPTVGTALRSPPPGTAPPRPASASPPAPPVAVAARAPRSAKAVPLGVYPSGGDPAGVAAFAVATGTHPQFLSEYLDGSSGWGGMDGAGGAGTWRSSGYRLVLGVPIIPDGTGGTLASGAAGAYNSYFVTLAQNLVNAGEADAILRLGWEFNGTWYNWSVGNSSDAANFATFFRNIVNAMRSVPGQAFQFVWNPNGDGPTNYTPDQAYPGSAYVDFIGTDVYDNCWCSPATPQGAWADQLSHPWGLNWLVSFAAQQGRPIAFPEWGLSRRSDGHGMGDDPYFIDSFAAWITQSDVAWTSYFNADPSGQADAITDGSFPLALAAFQRDFG